MLVCCNTLLEIQCTLSVLLSMGHNYITIVMINYWQHQANQAVFSICLINVIRIRKQNQDEMKTFVIYLNVNVNREWRLGVVRTARYVYIEWHCCPPPPSAIGCVPGCRSTSVPPKVGRTMKGYLPSGPMKGIRCSPPSKGNQLPHSEQLTLVFFCVCVCLSSLCSSDYHYVVHHVPRTLLERGRGKGASFLNRMFYAHVLVSVSCI